MKLSVGAASLALSTLVLGVVTAGCCEATSLGWRKSAEPYDESVVRVLPPDLRTSSLLSNDECVRACGDQPNLTCSLTADPVTKWSPNSVIVCRGRRVRTDGKAGDPTAYRVYRHARDLGLATSTGSLPREDCQVLCTDPWTDLDTCVIEVLGPREDPPPPHVRCAYHVPGSCG